MTVIKFYTKRLEDNVPEVDDYPCFILVETTWNDFGYFTNFILNYYENSRKKIEVGSVKILQTDSSETKLPSKFSKLSNKYCSLGQSNSYYQNFREIFDKKDVKKILTDLNDVVYSKAALNKFRELPGFSASLLRDSEAFKAYQESTLLLKGEEVKNNFYLDFSTEIPSFQIPHRAKFNFSKRGPLSKRMAAIIGKNGSGKTQYLARLATSLSGSENTGSFPSRGKPLFSRVIAISYSLFDHFEKPDRTKSQSYFFCGFQSEKEFDSKYGLERRLNRALDQVREQNRFTELRLYLTKLLGEEFINQFNQFIDSKQRFIFSDSNQGYSKLSSGQTILLIVLTEILAYTKEDSILLFDEPETHIHPNAISQLVGIIHEILIRYDAFAIIATHSPQIVQEIPSSLIFYFDNVRWNPPVTPIGFETFGENLTVLTEKIFQTLDVDEYYKRLIRTLIEDKKYSKDQVLKLFEREKVALSMNARIFIEYITQSNAKSK